MFYGKTITAYEPTKGGKAVESKTEIFQTIIVSIEKGPTDIYSALDDVFDPERVLLDGRRIPRFGTIETMPPILQINVNRVVWDNTAKDQVKLDYPLQLQETIYMDRYIEGGPALLKRRKAVWAWKRELRQLEAKRDRLVKTIASDAKMPDVLDATSEFVMSLQANGVQDDLMDVDPLAVDADLSSHLQARSKALATQLSSLETRISGLKMSIKDQFDGMEEYAYRLYALFMHRGSAGAGHYWIYIRDFERGMWLNYNDEHVNEEPDPNKILVQEDGSRGRPATPYFLVYVRDGIQNQLVQTLCRNIPSADVEMTGGEPQVIEGIEVKKGG